MKPSRRAITASAMGLLLLLGLWAKGHTAPETPRSPGSAETQSAMTGMQALVLGVVEGVTEYLPVSSTGHLLLAQRAMGIGGRRAPSPRDDKRRKEASDTYAICIQGGAILAVLFLLPSRRVRGMALGLMGRDPAGLQLAIRVALAFVPAALLGLLLESRIKSLLFGPWPVVAAWLVGGAGILWVSQWMRSMEGRGTGFRGGSDLPRGVPYRRCPVHGHVAGGEQGVSPPSWEGFWSASPCPRQWSSASSWAS